MRKNKKKKKKKLKEEEQGEKEKEKEEEKKKRRRGMQSEMTEKTISWLRKSQKAFGCGAAVGPQSQTRNPSLIHILYLLIKHEPINSLCKPSKRATK